MLLLLLLLLVGLHLIVPSGASSPPPPSLAKELPSARFPTVSLAIDGGPGKGQVNVSELRVPADRFQSPHFQFGLSPPNAVQLISRGGTVNARGLWSAWYEMVGITFYSTGWVDLVATDIRAVLSLGLAHSEEHPQLRVFGCTADVGDVQVQIGGGVIPWLVNLFRSELGTALRRTVHSQLCSIIQSSIVVQLNSMLASLPTRLPLGDTLFLKYAFSNDTQVTSSFLQTFAFVELSFSSPAVPFQCPLRAPSPLPLTPPGNSSSMLSLWLDQSLFQCLLRSMHDSQLLQLVVGPSFDGGHLAKFLRTNCAFYQLCLGRFFPALGRLHPDQHVDLRFHSASEPSLHFPTAPGDALLLSSHFFVDMHISPWTTHSREVLARLEMNSSAGLMPRLEAGRLKGRLEKELEVHFAELNSFIGNFSQKFLDTFSLLVKPLLEVTLESTLRVGIPLPSLEGIRMGNESTLTLWPKGELRVDAQLEYVVQAWQMASRDFGGSQTTIK